MAISTPTLNDLIAVNEEIAALVRAGVPLEQGLASLAAELPTGSGRLAARLAERTERGATLVEAIDAEGARLPAIYRAVVAAGLRTGRLDVALDGLVDTARRLAELRRVTGLALVYPLLLVGTAWLLVGLAVSTVLPEFVVFSGPQGRFHGSAMTPWMLLMTVVVVVLGLITVGMGVWWWRNRTAGALGGSSAGEAKTSSRGGFGRAIGIGRVRRLSQVAAFADLLALLVEHGVPLADALDLAVEAAGARLLQPLIRRLASHVQAGGRTTDAREAVDQLPPLLRLALLSDRDEAAMVAGLHAAAETYRHRADQDADWLMLRIPVLLTLVLGGGTVAAYAALVLGPYISTLHSLSGL